VSSDRLALDRDPHRANGGAGSSARILHLVKSEPERQAIESGQIDAVMDPATGSAVLLPEAQAALHEDKARVRSLLALSSDWCWEQDEFYRFVSHTGASSGSSGIYDESIIGKTLRDAPFDGMSEADWQTHRRLLEWRATFRDLELRCTDRAGEKRWASISGEPIFDEQDQFRGYRGTMRDITLRKQSEALAHKPIRIACDTLHALAIRVWVLDSAGTVIMANQPPEALAAGNRGIGAPVPDGANYLDACDKARGKERADGAAIAAGIRRVIARESPLFRHDYVCNSPSGRSGFNLTATAFPGDGAARVIVSRENITERKQMEQGPVSGFERTHGELLDRKVAKGDPIANKLLAALPRKDYQSLLGGLDPVTLNYGEVLYEPGEPSRYVYFPNDALVSLLATVEGHQALEVGLVGCDGMVGISLALGMRASPVRGLVQATGTAMRMNVVRFRKELRKSPRLQSELCHLLHAQLFQARQTAACNRFHVVEARLARWLLTTRDRVRSDQFLLTQEFLSHLLGVRRVGISAAAGALQKRKLIGYSRGKISILDRKGLEAASCSCYGTINRV
jgi:PAS domain S-box-containing protein